MNIDRYDDQNNEHSRTNESWAALRLATAFVFLLVGVYVLDVLNSDSAIPADATWQWQLQGEVNTGYDVDVYDVDMIETSADALEELRSADRVIICYFSAGTQESWRDDAARFPDDVLGNDVDGWPGERWVDVTNPTVREIITDRLDVAVERDCDGVEPDNVNAFKNDNGVGITAENQLEFNRWLADQAHQRGLMIGLKSNPTQAAELVDEFDFFLSEQCFEFDECDALQPFIDAGKPVFNTEYADRYVNDVAAREELCAASSEAGIQTLVLPSALDDEFRHTCAK